MEFPWNHSNIERKNVLTASKAFFSRQKYDNLLTKAIHPPRKASPPAPLTLNFLAKHTQRIYSEASPMPKPRKITSQIQIENLDWNVLSLPDSAKMAEFDAFDKRQRRQDSFLSQFLERFGPGISALCPLRPVTRPFSPKKCPALAAPCTQERGFCSTNPAARAHNPQPCGTEAREKNENRQKGEM